MTAREAIIRALAGARASASVAVDQAERAWRVYHGQLSRRAEARDLGQAERDALQAGDACYSMAVRAREDVHTGAELARLAGRLGGFVDGAPTPAPASLRLLARELCDRRAGEGLLSFVQREPRQVAMDAGLELARDGLRQLADALEACQALDASAVPVPDPETATAGV